MKQVVIKSGAAQLASVPAPFVEPKTILVNVEYSLISSGTEMRSVQLSSMPLYKRALKQPENVKKVLVSLKENGLQSTISRVRGKLDFGTPTGYSAAGKIVGIGDQVDNFKVGDLVACAGAGIANHAEIINVPVNLSVKLPKNLNTLLGSTVTLGSIATQGVRRLNPSLDEFIVVVGAGLLGIITLQLLKANGCRVAVIDISEKRLAYAQTLGADHLINATTGDYSQEINHHTNGYGADGAIITAGSQSNDIVHYAALATRRKGRVVLVGDVGLALKREDFYQKEIDFLISCSYGPGRYDPSYEIEGQDYPLPYVRWTENRNMESYLHLLSQQKIQIPTDQIFDVLECEKAYEALNAGSESPIAVFLKYARSFEEKNKTKIVFSIPSKSNINMAIVGASSFVQSIHIPNLKKLKQCNLRAVMSKTGTNASALAQQVNAAYATTDFQEILSDPDVDSILISSRHQLHGQQVLQALKAGKSVFVEKPLATNQNDLEALKAYFKQTANPPLLMTGFNRRFSPVMTILKGHLEHRKTPLIINYRMNAGFIPRNHWVQTEEGGGRNIGEACHIYDLFNFLTGSSPVNKIGTSIRPAGEHWLKNDNFIATISYADGSIATLTYTSQGSKNFPKECMDMFVDGCVYSMNDYKNLTKTETKTQILYNSEVTDKGHKNEIRSFVEALENGHNWPISLDEQIYATQISFDIEQALQKE